MTITKPRLRTRPTPAAAPLHLPMSYEEYLVWYDEERRGEWVDGEVIVTMPTSVLHQDIVAFLATLLRLFVQSRRLGKVLTETFEMRAVPGGSARLPDILFVATAHLERLTAQRLVGPADLVVEVVSPESATRDRREKFREYEAAGVGEYWVIDPRSQRVRADFRQRTSDGRFRSLPVSPDGRCHSAVVPGFWVDVNWFRGAELPDPLLVFAQLVGMPEQLLAGLRTV